MLKLISLWLSVHILTYWTTGITIALWGWLLCQSNQTTCSFPNLFTYLFEYPPHSTPDLRILIKGYPWLYLSEYEIFLYFIFFYFWKFSILKYSPVLWKYEKLILFLFPVTFDFFYSSKPNAKSSLLIKLYFCNLPLLDYNLWCFLL